MNEWMKHITLYICFCGINYPYGLHGISKMKRKHKATKSWNYILSTWLHNASVWHTDTDLLVLPSAGLGQNDTSSLFWLLTPRIHWLAYKGLLRKRGQCVCSSFLSALSTWLIFMLASLSHKIWWAVIDFWQQLKSCASQSWGLALFFSFIPDSGRTTLIIKRVLKICFLRVLPE